MVFSQTTVALFFIIYLIAFYFVFIFNLYVFCYSILTARPFLIRGPQNQTAVVGTSVIFQCRIGGDPLPDVLWRRTASGGNMPLRKFYL